MQNGNRKISGIIINPHVILKKTGVTRPSKALRFPSHVSLDRVPCPLGVNQRKRGGAETLEVSHKKLLHGEGAPEAPNTVEESTKIMS